MKLKEGGDLFYKEKEQIFFFPPFLKLEKTDERLKGDIKVRRRRDW